MGLRVERARPALSGIAPMLIESLALLAAVASADPFARAGYAPHIGNGVRQIVNPAPYPATRADDAARPGFNGRLWFGPVVMGGVTTPFVADSANPGAASYGALPGGREQVYARVGELVVAINPFHRWNDNVHPAFERARAEYLQEQGYTGGVRTFMNDANFLGQMQVMPARADAGAADTADAPAAIDPRHIQPRAVIELAPDAPRFRSRMRVDAGQVDQALRRLGRSTGQVIRVIPAMDATVVAAR